MQRDEYRIDDFILSDCDPYGKSVMVYFRIPPFLADELDVLMRSGRFPFQTKHEASRWAFYRGIRALQEMENIDYASPLLHLPLILYRRWPSIDASEFFCELDTVVRHLWALGYRTARLRRFVEAVEQLIQSLPSEYGAARYARMMRQRRNNLIGIPDDQPIRPKVRNRDEL